MSSDQQHIDQLLERYLTLLNEYTQLRTQLSTFQADVYHSIARANFSGERGMRYGQDQYDERMRASRRVTITNGEDAIPRVTVARTSEDTTTVSEESTTVEEVHEDTGDEDTEEKERKARNDDPLRWFGILTPMPLRDAQRQSIKVVEGVVPRLVSVNAEMQHVEIEVRRARKRRAKASAKSKGTDEGAAVIMGQEVKAGV
ncbi:hypothetical protein VFPPC_13637 [Pochonia chlamydosporia 170]|uniref:Vacuolar ATPase assembly protein VMA22 n=1 Tax=Pochonia chlamydosporia 170 TaxID=1380566 RepID=A0A179FT26_METCM|nr:hypothetical protein VFPPC_13637 [Pochonia chlamydosporia 170]OAQ68169.1 hypothetical protein VFPPC_13637 [Pochonia chlamydosporia 170]